MLLLFKIPEEFSQDNFDPESTNTVKSLRPLRTKCQIICESPLGIRVVRYAVTKALEIIADNTAEIEVFRWDIFSLPATRECHSCWDNG